MCSVQNLQALWFCTSEPPDRRIRRDFSTRVIPLVRFLRPPAAPTLGFLVSYSPSGWPHGPTAEKVVSRRVNLYVPRSAAFAVPA
jgi:hypothetical protein